MKKLYIYAFIICMQLISVSNTLADVCQEQQNKIICGSGQLNNVNYLDDVIFNGTKINGHTKIIGDVTATHTQFNSMQITGDFKGENCEMDGIAKFTGDLRLKNSTFKAETDITGDTELKNVKSLAITKIVGNFISNDNNLNNLTLTSTQINFSNTTTNNIDFTPNPQQQNLYLANSTINGNIKFSSNNGVIYRDKYSVINGTVIGGKIINQ